jgi:lipoprotein NlpI
MRGAIEFDSPRSPAFMQILEAHEHCRMICIICFLMFFGQTPTADLVRDAQSARANNDSAKAYALLAQAIAAEPKGVRPHLVRAAFLEADDKLAEAIADWTTIVALAPEDLHARNARGIVLLKAGRAKEAVADFDAFLKKHPEHAKEHWQRGIACYYAGLYSEGIKQFESYQDFDNADIENALWRFMCMSKRDGLDKAKAAMLKIGDDRRVPMRDIYELYLGKKTPDDVLAAAVRGDLTPAQKNRQKFYAHLYLGIWHDLNGDAVKSLDHLNRAVEHRIGHTMWDVARVHRDRMKAASQIPPAK